MANYREIVTKAVIGKGKKVFSNHYFVTPQELPSTILGCWVINHKFSGSKTGDKILVEGSSDVNIWYSYENDTKTLVAADTIYYNEIVSVVKRRESDSLEDIIVRSLKQPNCTKIDIVDDKIEYDIEKELGIEIVGDIKVRIAIDEHEDEWDEIIDEQQEEKLMEEIDKAVEEEFIVSDNPTN